MGWGVKRQGCQGYCKKPIPNRSTAQRHVTGTKLIHTTDSRNSEHFSLTFGRYAGRIPVGAPVIPRTCAFAQTTAMSSFIASLVRTSNSSFLQDSVTLRSQKAQTSRKHCGHVAFNRTRSSSSAIIFSQPPTQGPVRLFVALYGYDYFIKGTRSEGVCEHTEEQDIYPPSAPPPHQKRRLARSWTQLDDKKLQDGPGIEFR